MPVKEGKYLYYIKESASGSFSDSTVIYINCAKHWEDYGEQIDSFSDDDWAELEFLAEEIGLNQVGDFCFECEVFITIEDLRETLNQEGLIEDPLYAEYMIEKYAGDSNEDDAIIEDFYDTGDY